MQVSLNQPVYLFRWTQCSPWIICSHIKFSRMPLECSLKIFAHGPPTSSKSSQWPAGVHSLCNSHEANLWFQSMWETVITALGYPVTLKPASHPASHSKRAPQPTSYTKHMKETWPEQRILLCSSNDHLQWGDLCKRGGCPSIGSLIQVDIAMRKATLFTYRCNWGSFSWRSCWAMELQGQNTLLIDLVCYKMSVQVTQDKLMTALQNTLSFTLISFRCMKAFTIMEVGTPRRFSLLFVKLFMIFLWYFFSQNQHLNKFMKQYQCV